MKLQGKISNWNDDKGFGFVEQNGGGEQAFVHIKAFKSRFRRPSNSDVIIYELVHEDNNRVKAENIQFTRDTSPLPKKQVNNHSVLRNYFTLLFVGGLFVSVIVGKLPLMLAGLYIIMSLITFVAYALDKSAAKNDRWRTKESTLHLFSFLGGWPGALLAQNKLRHKSSKKEFQRAYQVTVLLNIGMLIGFHTEAGADIIHTINTFLLNLPVLDELFRLF